jgi:hypothetical protein
MHRVGGAYRDVDHVAPEPAIHVVREYEVAPPRDPALFPSGASDPLADLALALD